MGQTETPPRGPKTAGGQAPPREGAGSFVGKGSSYGAFNTPALLQPGEARGQHTFPIKPHDYGGGVLSDGAATRTEGASPPGSRRVIWR
jgi:hypothetical protein